MGQSNARLKEVYNGIYTDETKVAKLHKFRYVFKNNPEEYHLFKKFNKARTAQRIVNFSAIGILAAGTILAINETNRDHDIPTEILVGALGLTTSAGIAIIGNLIAGPIKKNRKLNLLEVTGIATSESSYPILNISAGEYGLGVSYYF